MTTEAAAGSGRDRARTVRVWDPAVRASHWLIAALFAVSWFSAENGLMRVHFVSGLVMLGTLIFRLGWGFVGSPNARFADFVPTPARLAGYLARLRDAGYRPEPGHSPLGGLSVLALWTMLAVHLGLGLFAVDTDGLNSGPLASMISFDTGRQAAEIHETTFKVLLALIALHLGAVFYFLIGRKMNLIEPMVTGRSRVHRESARFLPGRQLLLRGGVMLAVAAGIVWWIAG